MSSPPATNASDPNPLARGNELWKQGLFPEAEAAYRNVLEGNPKAAWALYRLGEIHETRGDQVSAEGFFAQAIALDAGLVKLRDNATFWKRFKVANDLLEARNLAAAEPIFAELLVRNPQSAPVLTKLGKIAGEHGDTESALNHYERAIGAQPDYPWGHIGKAEVLDILGQTREAAWILETVQARADAPQVVKDRLQALRRKLHLTGESKESIRIRHWPGNARGSVPIEVAGPRVAVVSWCLAHEPVRRAMVLAEVASAAGLPAEIVGPIFPSYGEDLWPQLRDGERDVDVYGFLARSFADFVEGAIRLVMHRPADVVWVSKPRFPSLLIGFLYKLIHGANLVLDIDDDELAVVHADGPLSVEEFLRDLTPADWREPYAKRWTQLASAFISHADSITVCNPVLQQKFGGVIVRDARVEAQFAATQVKRDEVRCEFGLSEGDKVVPQTENRRAFSRDEVSTKANALRARAAIDAARTKKSFLPADVRRILGLLDTSMPGLLPDDCRAATKGVFRTGPRVGPLTDLRKGVNLVFFSEQNDSGLYGRRSDMLLQQFAAMTNIRKILHIDAPISLDALGTLVGAGDVEGHGRFVAANTINRFFEVSDDVRVARRSFVYRGKESQLLGRELPSIKEFSNAVEAWLAQLGMTENVLAWVCPVVPDFPQVQRRLGFSFVASDVIDDECQWPAQSAGRLQIEQSYRETFACTNAAFANCEFVRSWLAHEGYNPFVVPDGVEIFDDIDNWIVPVAISHLPRPVIGYCGNLTRHIDWDLIEYVATTRPNWSVVLIGEPGNDERCRAVASRYNVHMLGVLPYETACRHIAAFDVAMIPHSNTALSAHINPLKLYVYRSVGVPVVSTASASLEDFAGDIRVAESAEQFVAKLDEAVAERRRRGRIFPSQATMQALSWQSRAATIWQRLEEVFEAQRSRGSSVA